MHFHREIDERAVLLTPVVELVDGEWRPKRTLEKIARQMLKKPANARTLELIRHFDALTVKPHDRPPAPDTLLREFLYLNPAPVVDGDTPLPSPLPNGGDDTPLQSSPPPAEASAKGGGGKCARDFVVAAESASTSRSDRTAPPPPPPPPPPSSSSLSTSRRAQYQPNEDNPPIRVYDPANSDCLGCAFCSGVGPTYEKLRARFRAALCQLPPTAFVWEHVPPDVDAVRDPTRCPTVRVRRVGLANNIRE
eukprot:TRINITY_DN934_c1_g1_i1.p4 TRINITY_DN934_c1_g1~~TRINITY_DN934_c1_g1_i1.p4  ORF type:complete len:250 (-),score=142.39 TRINITY_DN934_c1_g1_i1:37-786(-)